MKQVKIILIIVFSYFFCSCEKKPFDHRNKYVGDYQIFSKREVIYSLNSYKDTIYDVLYDCSVKLGSQPNELDVFIDDPGNVENNTISVGISNSGVIGYAFFSGFIKENDIEISLSFQAQGGGTKTTYKGVKK